MNPSLLESNTKSRNRLKTLASSLSEAELSRQAGDGWTVAAILAHLAFWETRALALIQRWKVDGVGPSPIDIDNVNAAAKPLCLAIPPRAAAGLAVRAAESIDAEIEHLPGDLLAEIEVLVQAGKFRLDRSIHRDEHLDQIDRVLMG
jgi:hypothetical protein